jgi:hypothetical protein
MRILSLVTVFFILTVFSISCKDNYTKVKIAKMSHSFVKDVSYGIKDRNNFSLKYNNEKKVVEKSSDANVKYIQDKDVLIVKQLMSWDTRANGIITGYFEKDYGAVNRSEDSISFHIIKTNKLIKELVFDKGRSVYELNENGDIVINLAIPHEIDPGHIIKKTNKNNIMNIMVGFYGDFGQGGWDNTIKAIMFQYKKDIEVPFIDDYKEEDYKHYYDDM